MEMLIVVTGLVAAAGGALVLLVCLAGKRAQLVKAFNVQQEREAREKQLEQNQAKNRQNETSATLPASQLLPQE